MQENELSQAIRHTEQEIQKETQELQRKEEELRTREAELSQLRDKVREHEKAIPLLRQDLLKIKGKLVHNHDELKRVQTSYQEGLRKSGVKLR